MGLKKLKNRTILSISSYCEANVMHVNGSTKAKTALFWVLFRVIAKIWKKVQFGEATLLTQRLKPTFFSDFRALCMCGTRCHDSQWARKLKKSRPKTLVKSNKSTSWKISVQNVFFFAISKMAKNQFLNWGKSLETAKMQFHEIFVGQISFFAISKMTKNQFLTWENF